MALDLPALGSSGWGPKINTALTNLDSRVTQVETETLSGTGFPEGVVTAPVGTRYIDTAATNGAIEWIKASGIGNTGWRVEYGDTGYRDISGLLTNGWALVGNKWLLLRRRGQRVTIKIATIDKTNATSNALTSGVNWSGWSRTPNTNFPFDLGRGAWGICPYQAGSAQLIIDRTSLDVAGPHELAGAWDTDDLWPITLLGTAF